MTTTNISYSLYNIQDWALLRKKLIELSESKSEFTLRKEPDFKRIVLQYES